MNPENKNPEIIKNPEYRGLKSRNYKKNPESRDSNPEIKKLDPGNKNPEIIKHRESRGLKSRNYKNI